LFVFVIGVNFVYGTIKGIYNIDVVITIGDSTWVVDFLIFDVKFFLVDIIYIYFVFGCEENVVFACGNTPSFEVSSYTSVNFFGVEELSLGIGLVKYTSSLVVVSSVDEPDFIRGDDINSLWVANLSGKVIVYCYVLVGESAP
jgi:hypothetical protein